nr:hypothetical protein [Tanacetum cinerariifolium]
DSPLLGVNTPRSDEDRLKLMELMVFLLQKGENVAEDAAHDAIPSPPSHDIPSPSQEPSSPPQQPQSSPQAPPQGAKFPTHIQQKLEIIKLQAKVKRLERDNKVKSSKLRRLRKVGASRRVESADDIEDIFNQGRMIDDLDKDKGIYMQEDDLEVQEVVEVVTTAKLITDVVTAASQVSAASATISTAKLSIPAAALIVVAAYTRRRKGVIIRDPEEELSSKTPAETPKVKDKGIVQKAAKRRKLSEEAQEAEDLRKRLE